MNILNTIGSGITQAIDTVVEKNRYIAYTNRLKFVIKSETETLNRAYSALGKLNGIMQVLLKMGKGWYI